MRAELPLVQPKPLKHGGTELHYKTQILTGGEFRFGEKTYSAQQVVEKLKPLLTSQRVARIEEVVAGRTLNIATVCEHLYDIGNISAVMRSAESYGFLPFHIIEREGSGYKKSDRISRGTEKWLDIRKWRQAENSDKIEAIKNIKAQGFKVYVTDLQATVNIEDIDFTQKSAVVLGNEHAGISDVMRRHADGLFKLPMHGFAQSFNISVAAALVFSHIHRVRTKALGTSGDLSEDEKLSVTANYYLRTLDAAEKLFI